MIHEPLTYRTHHEAEINFIGASLQGYLSLTRYQLVELFGEPREDYDESKTTCQWELLIGDEETVVTIYDYRTPGAQNDDFSDWHIGGHRRQAVYDLADLLLQLEAVDPKMVWSICRPR
jgi:hypothetical protein